MSAARLLPKAIALAAAAWVIVVGIAALITFLLPESFASTARLLVRPAASGAAVGPPWTPAFAQPEVRVICSEVVLGPVIDHLNLRSAWAKRYGTPGPLAPAETLTLLRHQLQVSAVPHTALLSIQAYSQSPVEAAALANEVAEAYRDYCASRSMGVQVAVVEHAVPSLHPARPNKALNIALGVMAGSLVGVLVGGLVYLAPCLRESGAFSNPK